MPTPEEQAFESYSKPSFQTFYQAHFQELVAERLFRWWSRIDLVTAVLIGLTASGSAVAGWLLWSMPGWKLVWAIIAGTASLVSIGHGALGVAGRVKKLEEIRGQFCQLRVELETFRQQLIIGIKSDQAKKQFELLRGRYEKFMANNHPDILHNRKKLMSSVQDELDSLLRQKGYI
ncbi:MAG: hypothetical protein ACE5JJ_08585 [Nitrospinota bacterium]